MFRLDKNFHKSYNYKDKRKESDNYVHLSFIERMKVFAYLQSVAYNYPIDSPPKMDKTIHSVR